MESENIKTKITIIDLKNKEEIKIPILLSLEVTEMLVKDAIKSGFKIIVEPDN